MTEEIKGLTTLEVDDLQRKFGKNTVEVKKEFTTVKLLLGQYKNFITAFLLLAVVFSFFVGDMIDALFIALFIVFNGLFGFIQEFRAEKTIEKLKEMTAPTAVVARDGQEMEIDARDLVPGDTVILAEGARVPADGELITDVPLTVDESMLTGESVPVEKDKNDKVFCGTFIVGGRANMKVTEIGFNTRVGKIAVQLGESRKPSIPLADNLAALVKKIAVTTGALSVVLVLIGLLQGRELREVVLVAVSTLVAAVPEGLALVVTIALAVGAYRMVKRKTIVRKMAAIETLGSTTIILSDKTGTITQNKMEVKKHWLPNKEHESLLLRCAVLGNTASLAVQEDNGKFEQVGDPTDAALLSYAKKQINEVDQFRREGKVIDEKPFDPETKIIEVSWEHQGRKHLFVRGAPETIIKKISEKEAKLAQKELEKYAKEGLRVIAFAHKSDHKHLTLLGFMGIYDAPRPEAAASIKEAEDAGIKIVMVTGDNPITARAIAEEIGMISEGELALTHDEIEKMSDEELFFLLPRVRIFARMQPEDKLRLVRLYKKRGEVVAVTGDGVNDALALSEAHIGVAMGGIGTDVAKEAADIVITDDNLHTIIRAVEEGRGIFDNIIKVVVFLLSTNFTEFFLIFFSILLGLPVPLTATQILWINLIGDGLPAMALAIDTKRNNLLKRPPRKITEQILNFSRLRFILLITFIFSVILMLVYGFHLSNGWVVPRLAIFNLLVIGEMIIIFIIRGGIFPINRLLIASVVATLVLQYFVSTIPYFKTLFNLW